MLCALAGHASDPVELSHCTFSVVRGSPGAPKESQMAEVARSGPSKEVRAHKNTVEILESPDFKALVAKRWSVSLLLLAVLFVGYYGYILLIATNKAFVAQKVGEVTTLAIPLGVGVIVFAWILTAFYVAWANKSYDPEVERIKGQLKR